MTTILEQNLIQKGYEPILKNAKSVFSENARYVMSLIGNLTSDSLLSYAAKNLKVSQDELFNSPTLFVAALQHTVGPKATSTAINEICERISQQINSKFNDISLENILNEVSKNEILEFLRNLSSQTHGLFVLRNNLDKSSIMENFLNLSIGTKDQKIVLSKTKIGNYADKIVPYDSFKGDEKISEKIVEYIKEIYSTNISTLPTKIVCDDIFWWYENKLKHEHFSLELEFKKKGIKKIISIDENLEVNCDAPRISQVINLLLSNSIKAIQPNLGEINIKASNEGDSLKVSVIDNGCGIPKEEFDKVFTKFYQVDMSTTREKGGVGLGLSICKKTIDAHDGNIWIESELNKETTVNFTIPIK